MVGRQRDRCQFCSSERVRFTCSLCRAERRRLLVRGFDCTRLPFSSRGSSCRGRASCAAALKGAHATTGLKSGDQLARFACTIQNHTYSVASRALVETPRPVTWHAVQTTAPQTDAAASGVLLAPCLVWCLRSPWSAACHATQACGRCGWPCCAMLCERPDCRRCVPTASGTRCWSTTPAASCRQQSA